MRLSSLILLLSAAACGPQYLGKPAPLEGELSDDEVATAPQGDDDDDDDDDDDGHTDQGSSGDDDDDDDDTAIDPDLDSDGDGVTDVVELEWGGDPYDPDSDGDGWDDGEELDLGTNPLDSSSYPQEGTWGIDSCAGSITGQGNNVGQVADNFTLTDQNGDDLQLHDFCGRAVLLVASAMWCGPCQSEAVDLAQTYQQYADDGFIVITLLGEDSFGQTPDQGDLQEWANSFGIDHPVVADPGFSVGARFVSGSALYLPSTSLLGPGAVVLERDSPVSTNDILSALP